MSSGLKKRSRQVYAEPLTMADIVSITTDARLYNTANTVIPKINRAALDSRFKPNHHIDAAKYKTIYATSDLHADYRNFLSYLEKLNIISLPHGGDPHNDEQIYDPMFILNTSWVPENSLLVILGDLVDGKRASSVIDPEGSFELLIHMFIYNLRLKAFEKGSEILFLIGNHDINTVLNTSNDFMYDGYVTDDAKRFFTTKEIRANCLEKFYLLSPYLYLSIDNKSVSEICMVHGGFHQIKANPYAGPEFDANVASLVDEWSGYNIDKEAIYKILIAAGNDLTKLSEVVSSTTDIQSLYEKMRFDQTPIEFLPSLEEKQMALNAAVQTDKEFDSTLTGDTSLTQDEPAPSPLWSRYYMDAIGAGLERKMCEKIRSDPNFKNKTIIVGHCPTSNDEFNAKKAAEKYIYNTCISGGCVISACDDDSDTKIIFVDTGLSSAFRHPTTLSSEKERNSEIIMLNNVKRGDVFGRYYNEIKRLTTAGDQYIIYPESESYEWKKFTTGGSRKTVKNKHKKINKTRNKKRARNIL